MSENKNKAKAKSVGVEVNAPVIRRYRKKPVEIEAVQWNGGCLADAMEIGELVGHRISINGQGELIIDTLEGRMRASKGDFIIRGVRGEIYPCKPDIFELTYEAV